MASSLLLRLSLRPVSAPGTTTPHNPLTPNLPFPLTLSSRRLNHHHPSIPALKPLKISNSYNSSGGTTPVTDRLISVVGYCLPFFNSLQFGRFLFTQYPRLSLIFNPILPVLSLYLSLPFASVVAFFGFYLGVVRNQSLSRYVRFNAMQALVLDVLLVVPVLFQRILDLGRAGFGYRMMVVGYTAVFVFMVMCFVYSVVSCVLGKTPYLPFVADAAGRQV